MRYLGVHTVTELRADMPTRCHTVAEFKVITFAQNMSEVAIRSYSSPLVGLMPVGPPNVRTRLRLPAKSRVQLSLAGL